MKKGEFDAIIFDLGGVILEIDYALPVAAFTNLGYTDFDSLYGKAQQASLFDQLEKGLISGEAFVQSVKDVLPNASDQQITDAWNAIIIGFPPQRLDYLKTVNAQLPTFLLSNTNEIHERCFNALLLEKHNAKDMHGFFTKAYLSHEINLRKPDAEAFRHVLQDQDLVPERTLFIDDLPQHIASARSLGIQTIQLESVHDLEDVLSPLLA
jgi:glucose-1-phosphatase